MICALGETWSRALDMRSAWQVAIFNGMFVGLEGKSAGGSSVKKRTHGKILSLFFLWTLPRGCNVWNCGSHFVTIRGPNLRMRLKCCEDGQAERWEESGLLITLL